MVSLVGTFFAVVSEIGQRVAADALVRAPILDAVGAILARIGIARRPAVFADHVGETRVHVGVEIDHFVVHDQTAEAADESVVVHRRFVPQHDFPIR